MSELRWLAHCTMRRLCISLRCDPVFTASGAGRVISNAAGMPYRKFSAEDCIGKGVGEERVFNISTGNYSTYLEMPLSNRRSKHTVVKH